MPYGNTENCTQDSVAPVTNRGDETDANSRAHPPYSLFPNLKSYTGSARDSAAHGDEQEIDAEPELNPTRPPSADQRVSPATIDISLIFGDRDSAVSLLFHPDDSAQDTLNEQLYGETARAMTGIEESVDGYRRHRRGIISEANLKKKLLRGIRQQIETHNSQRGPNDPSLALLHPSICNISSDVPERKPETTFAKSSCQSIAVTFDPNLHRSS